MNVQSSDDLESSSLNLGTFVVLLLAMAVGLLAAVLVLPLWSGSLTSSLLGPAPKAYWYLSRGTAFVALGLLWLSMALGIGITNKMARLWPGAPAAFAVHEYVSLLGLAFALFHALILLGDHYINFSLAQVLVPFATASYRPLWVGLGQAGFYVWAIVTFTFYVRRQIGHRAWRLIHYASFAMFLMALIHGLLSGTDTSATWAQWLYWSFGGSTLFLTVYRILARPAAQSVPRAIPVRPAQSPVPAASEGLSRS